MSLGDVHLYSNHIEPITKQLERIPYSFPTLKLPEFNTLKDVEKLTFADFTLEKYKFYPNIKMEMIA